jgi:hypothetical protein
MQTVSKSNKAGYESLLKIYRETDLSQEKVRVLGNSIFLFHQGLFFGGNERFLGPDKFCDPFLGRFFGILS